MSFFQFATCERERALAFLRKLYPNRKVEDTKKCAGPLLDLVEKDVVRITDPDHHQAMVVPGTHWVEEERGDIVALCQKFHDDLMATTA